MWAPITFHLSETLRKDISLYPRSVADEMTWTRLMAVRLAEQVLRRRSRQGRGGIVVNNHTQTAREMQTKPVE